ncbi:MAG: DEDD exonuclease domain-containing protein [Frankiales bacterium]|nr:DEDD exonuclease domain-containing protein [Frankiales bacterium]
MEPEHLARRRPAQPTFDDLGTPLPEVTFVVVDLETTGGTPSEAGITEIGAVKVRGGEVLGEFQTLVQPGVSVPPFIALLTGITDAMLVDAPPLGAAVPAFLDFAAGSVLVAHNAPYDVSFLKGACARLGRPWPEHTVVDTARLARAVLLRDEVRNCKLGTLAQHFRASTVPDHRALSDARATVDVLHGLIERVGSLGVHSLEDLATYTSRVSPSQRRKRHLAEGLPDSPGVYVFRDSQGRALYVGKSGRIRSRVRTYFTASEKRTRMAEMVGIAERVDAIPCATPLEAEVRELRLIAELAPRYNRRSRNPERAVWVKLTAEPFPRLSVVRRVRDDAASGAAYLGPFRSRRTAGEAVEALQAAIGLRTCTDRISPTRTSSACALAEMGRCAAPCVGAVDVAGYAPLVEAARHALLDDVRAVEAALLARLRTLAADLRYEEAAQWRDRLEAFARGAATAQEISALAAHAQLVAARPVADGGWEVHVVRHGRLAGAASVPPGVDPRPVVDALLATSEDVAAGAGPAPAALVEETTRILRWLESDGVRLVPQARATPWALPAHGAAGLLARLAAAARTDVLRLPAAHSLRPAG